MSGKPRPKIRWYRHTKELLPSADFTMIYLDDGTVTLIVNEIYPDDSGEITCQAKNKYGIAVTTSTVTVTGNPS